MMLALVGLAVISVLELALWLPFCWKRRVFVARLLAVALLVATVAVLITYLRVWTVLLAVFSLYRAVNLARISANRIQPDYLFHASRKTALWLMCMQLITAGAAGLGYQYDVSNNLWWSLLAGVQFVGSLILLASTLRHLRTTRRPSKEPLRQSELPSLTVAIPARNETAELEACLQSLTASTYPKLEIIVLDDCSQNKRTPEIIRGFAHGGVRFIAGTPPGDGWLAKNHAYAQLAANANSELLLFCGVDTRFEPHSLTVLVSTLLQKHKSMMSVLPRNIRARSGPLLPWFLQPSRYAWELALPRRFLQRPPVLSTCWLITRQALEAAGGFGAVRRKGIPESYFARATVSHGDGYSFVQADSAMGVISEKSLEEQRATAVRTRYLQLHRRPEMTVLVSLAELSILVWPFVLFVAALTGGQPGLIIVSGLSAVINLFIYGRLVNLTYRRFIVRGFLLLPIAALYDIGLLNYSMWQYEFSEVLWKGRNVCIPIMRVISELPKA
jgi:glycosyltransferase involved in cell wall biosynthesis